MKMEVVSMDGGVYLSHYNSFAVGVAIYSGEDAIVYDNFRIKEIELVDESRESIELPILGIFATLGNEINLSEQKPLFKVIDIYKYIKAENGLPVGSFELIIEIELIVKKSLASTETYKQILSAKSNIIIDEELE